MNSNNCIFATSKYYRQAYATAQKVAKPLGYSFLSQKQHSNVKVQKGSLVKKILFDKPLIKQISNKKTPSNKISQYLLAEDRKKFTYLSAHPMSLITRTNPEINQQLTQIYAPSINESSKNLIDFVNSIHTINKQSFFHISDYALSKYIIYYDGDNIKNLLHVMNILDKEFLEYQIKAIVSRNYQDQSQSFKKWSNHIQNIQFDQKHINNKQKIDDQINQIKRKAQQMDLMNNGIQFFIGDRTAHYKNHDILKQQIQNLQNLHYYLYLLCRNVIAEGQNAIIKLRGTIRNKTTDFLYIFKLIFNKISLVKPAYSNFLSSQKYLICEGFVFENALQLKPFLNDNFDLLKQHGEQRLLINPQMIFREEFQGDSTKNFNDSIIMRGLKQVLDLYLQNSNLEIYPPRTLLIEKLNSYEDSDLLYPIIEEIQKNIPSEEQIKTQQMQTRQGIDSAKPNKNNQSFKKGCTQQKQAALDIFAFMRQKNQSQSTPAPAPKKKQKRYKVDEQEQIINKLNQKYQEQQRIRQQNKKQKKEQEKKQKKQRDQDPYNTLNTHFEYSKY